MSIPKTSAKYKLFVLLAIVLASVLGVLIYRLVEAEKAHTEVNVETRYIPDATVIGSRTTAKYYFPWCYGARRLKPGQKAVFASKEDAEKSGYVAGGQCKGNEE